MVALLARTIIGGLFLAIGASFVMASAVSLGVPATSAGTHTVGQGANDLKPSQCSGITLTAVVSGSGVITGGAASELITGGSGVDSITGDDGDDCILSGGGDDTLRGSAGTDVCIGGPGTDSFPDGDCETEIQ